MLDLGGRSMAGKGLRTVYIKRLAREVCHVYGPDLVSLGVYGSVGRGTPRHDSDIDLLIVARNLPQGRYDTWVMFTGVERRMAGTLSEAMASGNGA
jgi:predicted nucleotidyltransferase